MKTTHMPTHPAAAARLMFATLAVAAAGAFGLAQNAQAQPVPPQPAASQAGPQGGPPGGPRGPRGMEGPGMRGMDGHGMRGMEGRGGRGMEGPGMRGGMGHEGGHGMMGMGQRMLDLVGATTEQRNQIKAIMDAAHKDMKATHDNARALRQQLQAAFSAPTVDARAVENLRTQMLAVHDTQSKRMTQAMLDASKVLSADQRKVLAEAFARQQERRALLDRQAAERAAFDKRNEKPAK